MSTPRMTEAEENTLRVLCTQMREQDPRAFMELLFQCLLNRLDDNSISGFKHNEGLEVDAMFVVFKGVKPAEWAEESLIELTQRIKKLSEE